MSKIELLMRELNLSDSVINQTLFKINYICSKYDYDDDSYSMKSLAMGGNGDGNGGNN